MRASPLAIRSRSSRRSASVSPEWRIATWSPKRARTAGRRAVVVGKPEREVDERRRHLPDDSFDGTDVHARGRRVFEPDDEAACATATERHRDDRAAFDAVVDLVCELAREDAR